MTQRVLITGGAGFIGSYVAEAELQAGNQVTIVDMAPVDKVRHIVDDDTCIYLRRSMTDRELMDSLVASSDLVYHLGAIANVQLYCTVPEQVLDTNINGVRVVAEACLRHGKKMFLASSSEIYGKNPRVPWREDADSVIASPERVRWCYAISKLVGEHYLQAYQRKGLRMAIGRFFNIYGPRLDDIGQGRVITCFLEKFLTGQDVLVVEPGDQSRCFTYVADAVEGIRRVARDACAEGHVFNIGTDCETTVLELAQLMKRVGQFDSRITVVPADRIYGDGYDDIFRRVPDVSKIDRMLGWRATTPLEVGLVPTIEYFRKQFSG